MPRFSNCLFLAITICLALVVQPFGLSAQTLTARADWRVQDSSISPIWRGVDVQLSLTQGVPFRVKHVNAPHRVIIDFNGLSGEANVDDMIRSQRVTDIGFGQIRAGWSRMVLTLDGPMIVGKSQMRIKQDGSGAMLSFVLRQTDEAGFAAAVEADGRGVALALADTAGVQDSDANVADQGLTIVLDPGHGGIDPGAEVGSYQEAALMLSFARALGEALIRDGHRVILTRNDDVFVSLRERVSIAHKTQADVLISLHADALSGGGARGATVYTLADEATDAASAQLARGHDRSDILGGVDLVGQDDTVAGVLIDLARRETQPRADRLAELLVGGIKASVDGINSRPRRQAGFAVLKAPDIPSVLVELGFMSDAQDLANLTNPEWRAQAILGLVAGVRLWAAEDAELAKRTRQ